MTFENKVKMSIEDWRKYENDEDYEFLQEQYEN